MSTSNPEMGVDSHSAIPTDMPNANDGTESRKIVSRAWSSLVAIHDGRKLIHNTKARSLGSLIRILLVTAFFTG